MAWMVDDGHDCFYFDWDSIMNHEALWPGWWTMNGRLGLTQQYGDVIFGFSVRSEGDYILSSTGTQEKAIGSHLLNGASTSTHRCNLRLGSVVTLP